MLQETFEKPPLFEVTFIYERIKKLPVKLRIFAVRIDMANEQYSIEIYEEDKIKLIMRQFNHNYT